jgi:hypothetical protein
MDDDQLERDPSAEDLEEQESDEVEAMELDEDDLEEAAGGDPGQTHPDAPNPYIP